MQFIDDDVAQILEHASPTRVMGQNAGMQHVGIREHGVGAAADSFTRVLWRVTVIRERPDFGAQLAGQPLKRMKLVFGQRLGGEQINGARVTVGHQTIQDRKVVAQCLAAGGWRDHDDIFARRCHFQRLRLV